MADEIDLQATLSGDNDLAQRDLKEADFRGIDLSGRNFDGAYLQGADFSNANLSGSTFHRANTMKMKAVGADFSNSLANNTVFFGCDMQDSTLSGADLARSHFTRCDLSRSDLRGANFRSCVFGEGTTFSGAISDETTAFDDATIVRPLARDPAFRFYRVERGKLVRLREDEVTTGSDVHVGSSQRALVNAIESTKAALLRAANFPVPEFPQPPGIGHNQPPTEAVLEAEEIGATFAALDNLKEQFKVSLPERRTVESDIKVIEKSGSKIAIWLGQKANLFTDEFVKSAGQDLGKIRNWVALWMLASGQILLLLEAILKFF